jgi:HK97 family phage prohead protease
MGYLAANEQMGMEYRDVWPTAYINDLPDSAFLYIAPGGTKTGGRTDGAHRFFPVRDQNGKLDLPHLRNALGQIPKANISPAARKAATAEAMRLAKGTTVSGDVGEYSGSAGSGRSLPAEPGVITRGFDLVLEVRAEGDGRTVIGRAVPYGQTAPIGGGKTERFVMGAFSKQIGGGQLHTIRLHGSHTQRTAGEFPIGKTVHLAEQQDGLHGAWQLYDTSRGDEALQLVKTGEVTGLSIGFKALDGGTKLGADGAYERHAAHLDHVVLTTSPVYAGAQVMAVRSGHPIGGYRTALLQARRVLDRVKEE